MQCLLSHDQNNYLSIVYKVVNVLAILWSIAVSSRYRVTWNTNVRLHIVNYSRFVRTVCLITLGASKGPPNDVTIMYVFTNAPMRESRHTFL
jgi:hypothetical protein